MKAIGVFDSGIGGLSVLKVLRQYFPCESFLYFADNAYRPYGEKTEKQIYIRSQRIIEWMIHQGVKLVVVACHTSSAVLENLKFPIPVITMVPPALESVFSRAFTKGLGVIATALSVTKGTLARYLTEEGFLYPIYARACPELVPLIENQKWDQAQTYFHHHVAWVLNQGVDYILYGCTHYPFLDTFLSPELRLHMIDPAHHLATLIENTLNTEKISFHGPGKKELKLYHTGEPGELIHHIERLGLKCTNFRNIDLSSRYTL